MTRLLRIKLSYANVVSTLALFIALGGSAYAVNELTGADIQDGSLTGADVRGAAATATTAAVEGSLTGDDIRKQSIGLADLATNSVNGARIVDNSVRAEDILESSLGTVPSAEKATDADKLGGLPASAYLPQFLVRQSDDADVTPFTGAVTETAQCGVDEKAIGGGYRSFWRVEWPSGYFSVRQNGPTDDGTGWSITISVWMDPGEENADLNFRALAQCMRHAG